MTHSKNVLFDNISLRNGIITYNDFQIDPDLPLDTQDLSFKEDLVQIEFGEKYCIDIGWYPDFDPKGHFWIRVIQYIEWDNPLFSKECKDIATLKKYLQEAIDFVESLDNN